MTDTSESPEYGLRVTGEFRLAPRTTLGTGVECKGNAIVGEDARIGGDLSTSGTASVGAGAEIEGSLYAGDGIEWDGSAKAGGLRSDGQLRLGEHALAEAVDARRGAAPLDLGSVGE